jgi:LPXTG-motif cell wall-anchored protein
VARVGTGDLRAKAGWPEGCGVAGTGPAASSSVALADATVLPGVGGTSLLHVAHSVSSGADAGMTVRDHRVAATVSARVGLADLRLFEGRSETLQVRVITAPTLSATAGGTVARSSVRYTAPLIEVKRPNGTVQTLDAPGKRIDVPVAPAVLRALGALGALGTGGWATAGAVLRLTIGSVSQHVTATAVTAEAVTLRVQLLNGGATLLDVGVGVLEASASAPTDAPPAPVPASAGSLPVTGIDVGWLLGIGVLIAIGGRLLLVLSRRRSAGAGPPIPAADAPSSPGRGPAGGS